jgi:hypothetical protein
MFKIKSMISQVEKLSRQYVNVGDTEQIPDYRKAEYKAFKSGYLANPDKSYAQMDILWQTLAAANMLLDTLSSSDDKIGKQVIRIRKVLAENRP